jgi:8-oxo-dGTP diphosphatase
MNNKAKIVLQVAIKAVIVKDGKVLILREAAKHNTNTHIGRYQMPGGRVEPGEVFSKALDREIFEETKLRVKQLDPILVGEWRPVIKGVPHQIVGMFIVCEAKTFKIELSEEHDAFEWINPKDYERYNILPPDCQAVARYAENQ